MDSRYPECVVDGGLFAWPDRDIPRKSLSNASLGLDRFAQSLHRRSSILSERESRYFGRLAAWLASAYHQDTHRITNQSPHERYFTEERIVRSVAIKEVESCFYDYYQRKVDPTYSDVSINGR